MGGRQETIDNLRRLAVDPAATEPEAALALRKAETLEAQQLPQRQPKPQPATQRPTPATTHKPAPKPWTQKIHETLEVAAFIIWCATVVAIVVLKPFHTAAFVAACMIVWACYMTARSSGTVEPPRGTRTDVVPQSTAVRRHDGH